MRLHSGLASAALALGAGCAVDRPADRTVVIPIGVLATTPVPTLTDGRSQNTRIADILFLRLANLSPGLNTTGDAGYLPMLADSWERLDELTLAFHLDPRAQWHDGVPVSAADVVFTFERARDPAITPQLATALSSIVDVRAEDDATVVFEFDRPYPEQFYTATHHVQPLPAHLLAHLPPDSVASSPYLQAPVGNGAFTYQALIPGRQLVLAANDDFFLGRPEIDRVVFLLAADADARVNLLLSGEADVLQSVATADVPRLEAAPNLRIIAMPGNGVGYLLFNQRDPADLDRPHPILSDRRVRRAITQALDREAMLRAVYQDYADLPQGPVAQLHAIRDTSDPGILYDPEGAKTLLREAGWQEIEDGWERDEEPLALTLNYPTTSRVRSQFAQLIQEQLRQIGIHLELEGLEGSVWFERRGNRDFEIDFSSAIMDPSPSGIQQSWTCAGIEGGSNLARYCNPVVDSLLELAIYGTDNVLPMWHQALAVMQADAPAAFIYSPQMIFAVDRRFGNVEIVPYSYWLNLWRWTVDGSSTSDQSS